MAQGRETIGRHIDTLGREWDVERYLQTNAGICSLTGIPNGENRLCRVSNNRRGNHRDVT
jgi:hypothetical protein